VSLNSRSVCHKSPDEFTYRHGATPLYKCVVDLISEARLPAMYFLREFVEIGGLIAYAFDLVGLNQRVAQDIDAIVKGANPGNNLAHNRRDGISVAACRDPRGQEVAVFSGPNAQERALRYADRQYGYFEEIRFGP
jgi:hypothetical protein